jgi:hypothetical protein
MKMKIPKTKISFQLKTVFLAFTKAMTELIVNKNNNKLANLEGTKGNNKAKNRLISTRDFSFSCAIQFILIEQFFR